MTEPNGKQESAGESRPQPAEQAPRARLPRWLWITASVIAFASFTFALVYLVVSGKPHPDALSTGTAASASPASLPLGTVRPQGATPAKGRAAVAQPKTAAALGLAAGALPLPNALKAQVATWDAGRGGAELTVVSTQLGAVTQTGAVREYVQMKAACSTLAAGVKAAQADPPIPDAAMQALYAKALASLATGSAECLSGISEEPDGDELVLTHENQAMLNQSASALTVGATELYRATAEIKALRDR
jgi:hypothetical protein